MTTKEPLISVIMPVYNAEKYIRRSLESMLNQTYRNLEILIGDDASTDRSVNIISSYDDNRIKVFQYDQNLGYVKNCNTLFEKVTGDFIAFQDADDYASFDKFEKQLDAFQANTELAICGTNFIAYTEDGQPMFCSSFEESHQDVYNAIPSYFPVKPSSFLLKREVYEAIGGYNLFWDRVGGEDYYWFALMLEKYKFFNLKEPLYHYIYSPNSITRTIDNPRKLYAFNILQDLVIQLRTKGSNDLIEGNQLKLETLEQKYAAPFRENKSYIHQKQAVTAFDQGQYLSAVQQMIKAVQKKPASTYNYRTLIYFTRNGIINSVKRKWYRYKGSERNARK